MVLAVPDEPARERKPVLRDELAAVVVKQQYPPERLHYLERISIPPVASLASRRRPPRWASSQEPHPCFSVGLAPNAVKLRDERSGLEVRSKPKQETRA
ncbi:MAG: hypothetical protein JXA30_19925 [Deltaproteobacteria bacterium]|nr:hypothetical protein [Deltaproteobacteria bacterium]